jgi:hypothetical protein
MSRDPISTFREAALKERLIGILQSPEAQKIDFFLGYMHISGLGYLRVADALRRGSMQISIGTVPEGAAAAFSNARNLFHFPDKTYGILAGERSDMVHEATHAMKSLLYPFKVGWSVTDTQDEAAAFVAGALYMLYAGASFTGAPAFVKAIQIARSIQGQKGAIVPARDEGHLRAFIAAHPVYSEAGINYCSTLYRP